MFPITFIHPYPIISKSFIYFHLVCIWLSICSYLSLVHVIVVMYIVCLLSRRSNNGVSSREQMLFLTRKKLSASASNLLENDVGGVTSYDTVLSQLQGQLNRAFRDKVRICQEI